MSHIIDLIIWSLVFVVGQDWGRFIRLYKCLVRKYCVKPHNSSYSNPTLIKEYVVKLKSIDCHVKKFILEKTKTDQSSYFTPIILFLTSQVWTIQTLTCLYFPLVLTTYVTVGKQIHYSHTLIHKHEQNSHISSFIILLAILIIF